MKGNVLRSQLQGLTVGIEYSQKPCGFRILHSAAMTSAQARIADTIEIFYGAADGGSEGAMAGHAYKRSVDELDSTFSRELVSRRLFLCWNLGLLTIAHPFCRTSRIEQRSQNHS